MGQKSGKGETDFRTKGGRLEPGLWAPGSCWHSPRGKLVFSPSCQAKKENQHEPGELCWDEIPSAQLQREPQAGNWWRRWLPASRVPQCPQGRAELLRVSRISSGAGQGCRARSGFSTGCSCTQLPAGTRTPNFMCRQWHSKCYSRCGWQGARQGWAQIITHFFPFLHPYGGSSALTCIGWSS